MAMEHEPEKSLLQQARDQRGWGQRELAEMLNVGVSTVRSWEKGTYLPSPELRKRVCDLFQMTPEELGLVKKRTKQPKVQTVSNPNFDDNGVSVAHDVRGITNQDPNRQRMLKRVRSHWISGFLDHSLLDQDTLIHLRLREQPDAVVNPWADAMQQTNLPPRRLPEETHVRDVYDEADGALLILGEPGAGKTTLLLDLARELLNRAKYNANHPIPVVFNLSAWAEKRQALTEWLIGELNAKYQVPRKLGKLWITTDNVFPLLDGLDEMETDARSACIKAINAYRQEHGFIPMVVCGRTSEYLAQSYRLALGKAIIIEQLRWEEIADYLSKAGKSLRGVKLALQSDPSLREMISTPLMLQIVAQTFHIASIDEILSVQDKASRRRLIFEKYVDVVLERRGPVNQYRSEQAIHWLTWLAKNMQEHNQTEFYLEHMQPDLLLPDQQRQRFHWTIVQVVCCLEAFMLAATLAWLRGGRTFGEVGGGLLAELGSGPWERVLGWMASGLGLRGLGGGGLVSLVFAIVAVLVGIMIDRGGTDGSEEPRGTHVRRGIIQGMRNGCICAGLVGGFCLLLFGARSGLISGLSYGSSFGILTGLIIGTLTGLTASLREEQPVKRRFLVGILPGLCALIGFWGVDVALHVVDDFDYGFVIAVFFYVAYSFGRANERLRIGPEIQPAEIVTWSWYSVRKKLLSHVTRGGVIGLITILCVTLCLGLVSGIAHGLAYGIALGCVFGPIVGVSVGVAGMLSGLLNSGLESEQLQKQERMRPNEGIRRSARNALLAALVFGPIGGGISGIACGVSFGLIGNLAAWPQISACFALVFTTLFSFYFLLVGGMMACLEHAYLRFALWRRGSIPLNSVRFLNFASERILLRKIGGGYMFIHSLLLQYFAEQSSPDKERNGHVRRKHATYT